MDISHKLLDIGYHYGKDLPLGEWIQTQSTAK